MLAVVGFLLTQYVHLPGDQFQVGPIEALTSVSVGAHAQVFSCEFSRRLEGGEGGGVSYDLYALAVRLLSVEVVGGVVLDAGVSSGVIQVSTLNLVGSWACACRDLCECSVFVVSVLLCL